MKTLKKLILALVGLMLLVSTAIAGVAIYAPLGPTMGGGLRIDLAPSLYGQIYGTGAVGDTTAEYVVGGDLFYGNIGVGATVNMAKDIDSTTIVGLKYALEKAIIGGKVGIVANIISLDTTDGADPNIILVPSINAYLVIPL